MNVVFKFTVPLTSGLIMFLVLIPRLLVYFSLEHPIILALISPWATFVIVFIAGLILLSPWIVKPALTLPVLIIALLAAIILTLYFCGI